MAPDTERSLLINVAVLPPEEIETEIASLSARSQATGGLFQVDGLRRRAHLTLYMARFPDSSIADLKAAVAEIAGQAAISAVMQSGYYLTPGRYYEVSYQKTSNLVDLHSALLARLSAYRFRPENPLYEEYFGLYSQEQRFSAGRWGYDLGGDLYRPHITITQFGIPFGIPSADPVRSEQNLSFPMRQVGLFVVDQKGATTDLLATYELG